MKPTSEQIDRLKTKPIDGLTSFDAEGIANYINTNHAKNIVFILGAGISCASGIPDFRSPAPFFELSKELLPGKYKPTHTHYLPVVLHRHGLLRRVYTQNIDGLERIAGLPEDKIIECHGSFYTAHCMNCKAQYDINDIRPSLLKGEVPKCSKCNDGVIKPDIVFFGEDLSEKFYNNIQNHFQSMRFINHHWIFIKSCSS